VRGSPALDEVLGFFRKTYIPQYSKSIMGQQEVKVNAREMMTRLARLQADLDFIRGYVEDITLTEDDIQSIKQARRNLKEGKTISHDKLKKQLSL